MKAKGLYKILMPEGDMFISEISDTHITFTIKDGKGKVIQSSKSVQYQQGQEDGIYFDKFVLPLDYFTHIKETLE